MRRGPLTVFVHIPKTAGTTLVGVLRGNFPAGGVRVMGNVFHGAGGADRGPVVKLREAGRVLTRDVHMLGGHLPFGVHQYLPMDSRYITFLRDPVERTLSHYYRMLVVRKRNPIPEGITFEELLGGGEYLYDNLQTRMLSSDPEPFGEVTDEMLEQAKENLATKFVFFGLADRFDESLVLLQRRLELRSILYVSKRMTTSRPRTAESKEDLVPIAERFNAFDIELYRWASEHFAQTIKDQDGAFAVDFVALKTAVAGGPVTEKPPPASKLTRNQLWEELVSARAAVLGWEYEAAKARDPDESPPGEQDEDLRALLKQANQNLVELSDRVRGLEARMGPGESAEDEPAADEPDRPKKRERAKNAARLEQVRARIGELEDAIGDQAESARDVHVVRELERLRALAAQIEENAQEGAQRRPQTEDGTSKDGTSKAERRQTPHQLASRIAALTKTRDNNAANVARTEERLEELRKEITELEASGANGDAAGTGEGVDGTSRRDRLDRLRALASAKEERLELMKGRLSEVERRLSALTEEAAPGERGPKPAAERVLDKAPEGG